MHSEDDAVIIGDGCGARTLHILSFMCTIRMYSQTLIFYVQL